jgi:hypothetical protein
MVTLAILLLVLLVRQKSLWLAALFGWHPIVLLAGSVAGSAFSCFLPLLALAALPWRWHRWMRELLIVTPAAIALWWMAHVALAGLGESNGLLAACLRDLGIEGRRQAVALIAFAALLEFWVVLLALKRNWELARLWGHLVVIWLLVCPSVGPADLLPLVLLAPVAFVPGAWILSGTALGLFLLNPAGGTIEGEWVLFLVFVPAAIFELADLLKQTFRPCLVRGSLT